MKNNQGTDTDSGTGVLLLFSQSIKLDPVSDILFWCFDFIFFFKFFFDFGFVYDLIEDQNSIFFYSILFYRCFGAKSAHIQKCEFYSSETYGERDFHKHL